VHAIGTLSVLSDKLSLLSDWHVVADYASDVQKERKILPHPAGMMDSLGDSGSMFALIQVGSAGYGADSFGAVMQEWTWRNPLYCFQGFLF
jgi:hypothetical protein